MKKAVFLALVVLLSSEFRAHAQSTFGTILGTVTDTSGAAVPGATVKITDVERNAIREVKTDSSGNYEAFNSKPSNYRIDVIANGFQSYAATDLLLIARQTLRVDVPLQIGQLSESVNVEGSAGIIATDTQTIQASFDSQALIDLPANVRAAGNTSPYDLIGALPGVQADNGDGRTGRGANFSIQGGIQSMAQFSLDGISITDVGGNSPLTDAFPSVESISEIKVQGVGNNAEFAQAGDVTTVSKSGTNSLHGSLFWYHQNRALDATNYGAIEKPQKIGNDYGVSAGGPVFIPKIYNGKDKTFFFATFEGFQYPLGQTIQNTVPTDALRNGNFNGTGITVTDPTTGSPFLNNTIPTSRISSVAKGFLALFPLPNAGDVNTFHSSNYVDNRSNSYSSNQGDIRGDHYLTPSMSVFGRYSQKNITQARPQDLAVPSEDILDNYKLLVVSHNWAIRPNLLNEFRFGFTLRKGSQVLPYDGVAFTNSLGLQGIGPTFPFNGLPELNINGYTSLSTDRGNAESTSNTYQFNNNTTWTLGKHTLKFGFDIRHIRAQSALGFIGGDNYGQYNFSGSFTGDAFGDFLLGIPNNTGLDNVQQDNDGSSNGYAVYAQDTFRVTPKLTLEFGARWEYHPAYQDASGNIGNFDPSVAKSGQIVYPTGKEGLLAPLYLQSLNACPTIGSSTGPVVNGAPCTPVISAKQADLPEGLRTAPYRIVPRFGFAYRPFSDGKTVLRGGFGMFTTPSLGSIFYALTGTVQSNTSEFLNISPSGGPIFQWPQVTTGASGAVAPYGTAYFGTANDIQWKEPYSMQWNLSVDRDLGYNTGLRVSYIGMHTINLVWAPNLNQSYYSNEYYANQPLSERPFPNWGTVNNRSKGANAKYESLQAELRHRFKGGLTFQGAYTLAKNLADNQGPTPGGFAGENAGGRTMDLYNRSAEYGDVYATRRHRFILTGVYELPIGRGRQFMPKMNRLADGLIGGWRISSIFLVQTGPYLSPYFSNGDPSGTGSGFQRPQHPDRVKTGSVSNPTANQWIDPSAFVCPGSPGWTTGQPCTIGDDPSADLAPIGRFGNSGIGVVTGPGTVNLNMGLGKAFALTENVKFKVEGSFTNVLNHVNLGDPNLAIDSPDFGRVNSARAAEFGGSRTGQVSARIEF